MDGRMLVYHEHRNPGRPQLNMEEDRKVQKVPVGLAGLPKVLFVGKKWPRNTDPHGEARNRRDGTVQARGCWRRNLKDLWKEVSTELGDCQM